MQPSRFVEQIFARMLVRYGAQWIRMWEGVDPEAVKADWAEMLDGTRIEAIQHALNHLPKDRPPNAGQFVAICREYQHYEKPTALLPRPPASAGDKERVRKLLARAKAAITGH